MTVARFTRFTAVTFVAAATLQLPAVAETSAVMCGGQEATIIGTDDHDYLNGTSGDDVIAGLDGNDTINGGAGNDILCGGDGERTTLSGESGHDVLISETSGDLDGGLGNDTIDASAAPPGAATVSFRDATSGVKVDLRRGFARGVGRDTVIGVSNVDGTPFGDQVIGDATPNSVFSYGGDDVLYGLDGNDTLYSDSGNDRVVGGNGADSLSTGTGLDELIGGQDDDYMSGSSGDDTYTGGGGDDYMFESSTTTGNDAMSGGSGDDRLYGGFGNDIGDGGSHEASGDFCDPDIEQRVNCER